VRVVLTAEAEQDLAEIDAWWREHRRDAPNKFAEEFVIARQEIASTPLIRKVYGVRRGIVIRRWLMTETVKHVYYAVESDVVYILRVWDPRRGVGPKL
jgi:plasmid stabilization system protein ParE